MVDGSIMCGFKQVDTLRGRSCVKLTIDIKYWKSTQEVLTRPKYMNDIIVF
jgi:hypothetical protein